MRILKRYPKLVALGASIALVAGVATASAAVWSPGTGLFSMDPGDAAHVTCPNELSSGNQTANALDITCAPDPITTTTAAPPTTTTTVPPTTTTQPPPPTTTTIPPTTTTVAPPPPAFPDASNTGPPSGTVFTTYTGPTTITTCQTITNKIINSGLDIRVGNGHKVGDGLPACVTIINSVIHGSVDMSYTSRGFGPTTLDHVEISAATPGVGTLFDVYESNYTARFVNVHGGDGGFQCDGYCDIRDSFAHDFVFVSPNHMDAFITNGAYGAPITLNHNTFLCNFSNSQGGQSGGCSADVGFFGDFSAITNATVSNNLFKASQGQFFWCAYSGAFSPNKPHPTGSNLHWTGNTFERGASGKCGDTQGGPVADWQNGNGNLWSGNVWSDGTPLIK